MIWFWNLSGQQTFDKMNAATTKSQLSVNAKFNIPDLKVHYKCIFIFKMAALIYNCEENH